MDFLFYTFRISKLLLYVIELFSPCIKKDLKEVFQASALSGVLNILYDVFFEDKNKNIFNCQ